MALITRLSRLFTADVHAVLDRIEEPEALLKQAIRDMEDELARGELELARLARERRLLGKQRDAVNVRLDELAAELDVCFAAGEEDLARSLVRRKLGEERRARHLDDRLELAAQAGAELEARLEVERQQLGEMRQSAELAAAQSQEPAGAAAGDRGIGNDEVEAAFLREKQRRMQP